MSFHKKTILLVLISCSFMAGLVWAGDPALNGGKERILGGHGFMPSVYVGNPWVATTFKNHTGGGVALGLETPFENLDGDEVFVLDGDVFYASLGVSFQQRFGDKIALGASFSGNVRTGTNTHSLVAEGANVDRSVDLWLKYRIIRSESSQFTVGLGWNYDQIFVITPREFARGIIDNQDLDKSSLLHNVKSWTGVVTMGYAYAFSPTWGIRADGHVGVYEDPTSDGDSKATHRFGVMAEMDLKHKTGFPLGISLGRTQGFPNDDPGAGLSGTLLGFWYTGRESFVVGLETGYMTLPVAGMDETVDAMYGVFTLRYYF